MDIYAEPADIDPDVLNNLGPLRPLAGKWKGDKGVDVSPAKDGPETTKYREVATFDPVGPVVNGPQVLYGLKYAMTAWPLDKQDAFHEEIGYWLWDAPNQQVMRCFMVPRGVTLIAGGRATPESRVLEMAAKVGSEAYGTLCNPFLVAAFHVVRYDVKITIHSPESFSYAQTTHLKIRGQKDVFSHTDENTLARMAMA